MTGTWEDPPEYRDGGGGMQLRVPSVTPVVKRLLWINGIVFLVTFLLARWGTTLGAAVFTYFTLNPRVWIAWFPIPPLWQLVSYGFLHDVGSVFHLLYNLLALYFFGTMLEGIVGSRRFLFSYLAAIVIGGALQLAVMLAVSAARPELALPTLGASGGVLFAIVACATMRPNTQVIFILFPLRLRTLAMILVGIDVFGLLSGNLGTAYVVHLAGAAFGFLAVKLRWIWIDPLERAAQRREVKREQGQMDDAARLDKLLRQIHENGIHTLSRRDKEFLKRVSGRD
jgi:membrane associated rhomboid family serine protease